MNEIVAWAVFNRDGRLIVVTMEHPFTNGMDENNGLTCRPLTYADDPA